MVRGAIFDLDGTLVDSHLDFDAIRDEMNLPPGTSVLEALREMDEPQGRHCREILHRHESQGAQRASPLPGVDAFLGQLRKREIRLAIVTRNSRPLALAMLAKLDHPFEIVISRDDGPVKPDPWAVLHICKSWDLPPAETVVIGDFRFDIQAGQRAGAKTVFFTRGRDPAMLAETESADFLLESFTVTDNLLRWIDLGTFPRSC